MREPVNVTHDNRTTRKDTRPTNPRTTRDLWHRDVFVIDSRPTR